jgi:serine/threonine protein kinase
MTGKATKRVCAKCQFEDETGLKICPRDGSPMTSRGKDPLIGQLIADKYEILSMLGKGGMSVVYKAKHNMMSRMVAVKMLRPELVAVPQLLQRFKQESNAVSALRHPNIVTVFDYGLLNSSGTPYLIMDYLEGDVLSDILKRDKRLTPERAIPLFAQACDALAHAHDQGVIHRDIKPSNLLVRKEKNGEESLTIFDFGIAKMLGQDGSTIHKLTTSGEVFGSPLYMSPEQCSGEHVTKKTDTYSLACVFYEALCGQPPLGGTSPMETLMKHVNEDPPTLSEVGREYDIPAALEDAIMQALSKDPNDRQIDMRAFRDQILEAGNLRILSSSLHLTRENTIAGASEEMLAMASPHLTSGSMPQPPAKRKTTQRSQAIPTGKSGGKGSGKTSGSYQAAEPKKIPLPLLIGVAVVIAVGAMGGIVYMLMHNNEAIVVKPETTEEKPVDREFDGNIDFAELKKKSDYLQLSSVDKELKCRFIYDGKLVTAVPEPLSVGPAEETSSEHTDANCMVIPVELSPADISPVQAAQALFAKLFPKMTDENWENITENFPNLDVDTVLVQEITFPADAVKDAGGADSEKASEGEESSKSEGTDSAETAKSSDGATTGDADKEDAEESDATADGDASSDKTSTETSDTAKANESESAGAAKSGKICKEYIVYLKHDDRLVACQFIPLTISEEDLEKTIGKLIPALKKVVKS